MTLRWPSWLVPPRLGVVLGGGATLGAYEVGVIDVMARRGIVPDLLVGTSAGAINAAFWAMHPEPDAGERLLELWLGCDRSIMFPDGPVPMVGRLFTRKDHLTTQRGLARALGAALPAGALLDDARVPLAIVAADARTGEAVVLRSGPVAPAVLASAAIPGLWPTVEIAGARLIDGGFAGGSDIRVAAEAGMSDLFVVDVMGGAVLNGEMTVGQMLERAIRFNARHQTELAVRAFAAGARVAMLRPQLNGGPWFGDFSRTRQLYADGREAAEEFLARHLGPRRSVRPGLFEPTNSPPRTALKPMVANGHEPAAANGHQPAPANGHQSAPANGHQPVPPPAAR